MYSSICSKYTSFIFFFLMYRSIYLRLFQIRLNKWSSKSEQIRTPSFILALRGGKKENIAFFFFFWHKYFVRKKYIGTRKWKFSTSWCYLEYLKVVKHSFNCFNGKERTFIFAIRIIVKMWERCPYVQETNTLSNCSENERLALHLIIFQTFIWKILRSVNRQCINTHMDIYIYTCTNNFTYALYPYTERKLTCIKKNNNSI